MFPLNDLGPSALDHAVQDFFMDRIAVLGEAFLFFYRDHHEGNATEYWASGKHLVPVSIGIWLVNNGFPSQIRHLFLAHSAADILCFCQLRPDWLSVPENVVFAALGLLASAGQISFLRERFANAKIHTLFDTGLTGRVTDCKVALWLVGKDAVFRVKADLIQINYRNRKFNIPIDDFSLYRFERTIALRSGIRTHKPKGRFGSYRELFVNTR